jgi:ribosome-interacting GTPase 1
LRVAIPHDVILPGYPVFRFDSSGLAFQADCQGKARPANLPPQYFEAEKRYRRAKTPQEKIEALEEMFSLMPKHKGTDRMRAELRTKTAKFCEEAEKRPFVANKVGFGDVRAKPESLVSSCAGRFTVVLVSARRGDGLEQLRDGIYKALDVVRVHTKPPGGKADLTEPSVVRRGSTVGDVAETVHKDFARNLKYAQVWGSGKFNGQRVRRDYILQDGNIVELHI